MRRGVFARCALAIGIVATLPACEELPAAPDLPGDPPIATFQYNPVSPIYAGQTTVAFNASGARGIEGPIVSYTWAFGDGTTEVTSTSPTTTHTFTDTAARCLFVTYGVMLVVKDDRGGQGVASQPVTVTELPTPTAAECTGR